MNYSLSKSAPSRTSLTSPFELAIVKIALRLKSRPWKQGLPAFHRLRRDQFSVRSERLSRNLPDKDRPNAGPPKPIEAGNFRENSPLASVLFPTFCKEVDRPMIGCPGKRCHPSWLPAVQIAGEAVKAVANAITVSIAVVAVPVPSQSRLPASCTAISDTSARRIFRTACTWPLPCKWQLPPRARARTGSRHRLDRIGKAQHLQCAHPLPCRFRTGRTYPGAAAGVCYCPARCCSLSPAPRRPQAAGSGKSGAGPRPH